MEKGMDLEGRLDIKDELGLSSWVADRPFTEVGKLGRGILNLAWVCNEEALSTVYVTLPRPLNKFVAELGLGPLSPKTAELGFELT